MLSTGKYMKLILLSWFHKNWLVPRICLIVCLFERELRIQPMLISMFYVLIVCSFSRKIMVTSSVNCYGVSCRTSWCRLQRRNHEAQQTMPSKLEFARRIKNENDKDYYLWKLLRVVCVLTVETPYIRARGRNEDWSSHKICPLPSQFHAYYNVQTFISLKPVSVLHVISGW